VIGCWDWENPASGRLAQFPGTCSSKILLKLSDLWRASFWYFSGISFGMHLLSVLVWVWVSVSVFHSTLVSVSWWGFHSRSNPNSFEIVWLLCFSCCCSWNCFCAVLTAVFFLYWVQFWSIKIYLTPPEATAVVVIVIVNVALVVVDVVVDDDVIVLVLIVTDHIVFKWSFEAPGVCVGGRCGLGCFSWGWGCDKLL